MTTRPLAPVGGRWSPQMGGRGEIFAFTDWARQCQTNFFLYDSVASSKGTAFFSEPRLYGPSLGMQD